LGGGLAGQHKMDARIDVPVHSQRLLEYFQDSRRAGELAPPAVMVEINQPVCGDILRLSARFEDGRVAEARFKARGCTATIAAGSALTEWMTGKTPAELSALSPSVIDSALGELAVESKHAAALCVDAVRALLKAGALS
jgi:NifU-like protein involved in Fe-S cluster formation